MLKFLIVFLQKWKNITRKKPYLTGLLICSLVFIFYLPALNNFLLRDDFEWLNQSYQAWRNPLILFELINNFFRPLVKLSFLLNFTFFGTQVSYYNLTTILLHLVNVFLLYLLVLKVSKRMSLAVITSLAFGTSALYSEVTLWAAGRPDSILLIFILLAILYYYDFENKSLVIRQVSVALLVLGAIGSKETWIILPFLILSFLLVIKRVSLKTAIRFSFIPLHFFVLYVGYFIVRPLLLNTSSPASYANAQMADIIKKFAFLIFKYLGLGGLNLSPIWQYTIILPLFLLLIYLFLKRKNWLAFWGLIWMVVTISISLPIYYAPSRYNYLPLMGFWIMVIAFLSQEMKGLIKRYNIKPYIVSILAGLIFTYIISYQVVMLKWEIEDYHFQGESHKEVVEMYQKVKNQLPHNHPIIFVNLGTRQAVFEASRSMKGYVKLLFVRAKGIWQLVYIGPLANFSGQPFSEMMETVPGNELESIFKENFSVLVFTDRGFVLYEPFKKKLLDYYRQHRKLQSHVEVVRFVSLKTN